MSFDDVMAELRREYIGSLSDKVLEASSCLEKSDLRSFQNLFHKLKGSGSTYGIPEASQLGELVEECLRKNNVEITADLVTNPMVQSQMKAATELLKRIRDARKTDQVFALEKDPLYLLLLPEVNPAARVSSHGPE
jgi:HPt (histidine-containing phosphotransfer) domain-containing protein